MDNVKEYLSELGISEQEALDECVDWGKVGALHVAKLVGGQVIKTYDGTYDIQAKNVRLEVKTSVGKPRYKNKKHGDVYRAAFGKLNGTNGSKEFDAEILVAMWPDRTAWYFVLGLQDTLQFNHDKRTGSTQIAVTRGSQPHSKSRTLMERFQISRKDLCRLFSEDKVPINTVPEQFHSMRARIVKLNKLNWG